MSLLEAAAEIVALLESQDVPYVIVGGLAVQYWGEPRTTRDVDVTILVTPERFEVIANEILQRFRPRMSDALSFAQRHRILLVSSSQGFPIDISLGIPGYEEEVMRRAARVSFKGMPEMRLICAEDLIVHKCVAGRARDREDVERILIRQQLVVDVDYIRRWLQDFVPLIDTHNVQSVFKEAWQNAQRALAKETDS